MKKNILLLIFIMVNLAGCVLRSSPTGTDKSTQSVEIITPSFAPLPTTVLLKTATPEPKTRIITPTRTHLPPIDTATPSGHVTLTQLRTVSGIPESAKSQGSIVLAQLWEVHSYYESDARQITIWDLETDQQYNLLSGEEHVDVIIVSPDGRWLKYTKKEISESDNWFYPASLHIVSVEGQEQKMIPWKNEWGVISQWLDNEHLVIRRNAVGDDPYRTSFTAKWTLNPFTETISELPKDPDDIYDLFPKPDWSGIGMVSYNSDLTFRVYLSWNSHLILENMNTHQFLDILPEHYRNSTPCWSPSGQEFAVAVPLESYDEHNVPLHFELYRVSVEGEVVRLTDMTEYFEYYSIQNYTWSPDAKKIAFWLNTTDPYPDVSADRANLSVVDADTGDVTIYSLESSYSAEQKIVWLPDGHQLLVGVVNPEREQTLLVDIDENWTALVADGMVPVGWMISPNE
jgi:hypothetical protein